MRLRAGDARKRAKPDLELLPEMPLALDSEELLRVALKHWTAPRTDRHA